MLGAIWAQAADRVIGRDNDLPWHLPEDLHHFRDTTAGKAVIMGRRQWESLPEKVRPLPGRRNIVLSRNPAFVAPGAEVTGSLPAALELVAGREAWIIGGAEIYAEAMPFVDLLVVTEIDHTISGDRHAPPIGAEWRTTTRDPQDGGWHVSMSGLRYRVLTYARALTDRP